MREPDRGGDWDRRTFVARALGALALGALPVGCMPGVVPVAVRRGAIRVSPDRQPGLAEGGFLRLQPAGYPGQVYLLALEDGSYAAVSPICTHQGCTVNVEGERLVCPCHGSTYDRAGRLLRGPAPEPLRSFPVRVEEDGTIIVTVEES